MGLLFGVLSIKICQWPDRNATFFLKREKIRNFEAVYSAGS
jgi:hypothetical protein